MIKRNKINIYFISNFIFFGLLFLSCSGSEDQEQADPMIDPRFTFHQDLNKLYFAIKVESKYESKILDSVVVYWYGTSKENSPDIINLNDSGTSGDIDVTAESGNVTIAGSPSTDEMVFFNVMRDVSADNQSGDARLLGIQIFFTTDAANDA